MELKRKYLTSEELTSIVSELIKHSNAVEREIIKVGMVAQCLIDGMDKYENCNEMYDFVMENGVYFDMEVDNYYMIDKLVDKELGIDNIVKIFLDSLDNKLQGFDLGQSIEQLKDVMSNVDK